MKDVETKLKLSINLLKKFIDDPQKCMKSPNCKYCFFQNCYEANILVQEYEKDIATLEYPSGYTVTSIPIKHPVYSNSLTCSDCGLQLSVEVLGQPLVADRRLCSECLKKELSKDY